MNDICNKLRLRHLIMLNVKANNLPVTGEFWLMLAFRNESELRKIAADMNIFVK